MTYQKTLPKPIGLDSKIGMFAFRNRILDDIITLISYT